jgi:8-oxo-dGTP pyrophosphatase MutT (NUDIX family)
MNFEPQKFFIGLVDFFSVWLPGAILAYLITISPPFGSIPLEGAKDWVVFLVGSYLLGHFIFLLGSQLDFLYDNLRDGTRDGQIHRLAEDKPLSNPLTRWMGRRFLERGDAALRHVLRIKLAHLGPLGASRTVNAFQWSKVRLALHAADGLALVNRFEADSKFFRSLVVMLIIAIPWQLWAHWQWFSGFVEPEASGAARLALVLVLIVLTALLLGFSVWRFVDLRYKSIGLAYWLILAMESDSDPRSPVPRRSDGLTHAGGLVVRREPDGWRYLVVKAKRDPHDWVLPKGHIEPGEPCRVTAVREVLEEAGIWARPKRKLTDVKFVVQGEKVEARFYLMDHVRDEPQPAERIRWLRAMDDRDEAPRECEWWELAATGDDGRLPKEARAVVASARAALGVDRATPAPAPPAPSRRSSRRRPAGRHDK